jgi:Uma2 family endonuclease
MGTTTLLTFAEFEQLPEQPGKDELLDGEHFHLPPAFSNHSILVGRIFALLMHLIDGGKPRLVQVEAGYKIGPRTWLVPDVSVLHEGQPRSPYFAGAPAIAIEVISESNTARHIEGKRRAYLANGAAEVWVIYPETQSAWLYRAGHGEEFTGELRSRAFPEVRIDLMELFS